MSRRKGVSGRARAVTAPAPARKVVPVEGAPRRGLVAAALFVALFAVYVANFRVVSSGDAIPNRLLPISILREGNLDLDEFPWLWAKAGKGGKKLAYYVRYRAPHLYSGTTVATALVVTPLYVVPTRMLAGWDLDDVRARLLIVVMERVSAAVLSALSASVLFLVLSRLVTWRWALVLTATYGLGTSTWSISSQALWPHALNELAIVAVTAVLLRRDTSGLTLALAGLMSALAVANRPQLLGFAVLALVFVWRHQRRGLLAFVAVPLLAAAALIAYNLQVFRGLAGAYAKLDSFSTPLLSGLAGLLISPNRGLLIYTPIMAFAFWGAVRVWRTEAPPWMRYLVVALGIHLLLHAKFTEWWAGYAFGPRYMTDVLPILCLLLVYGLVPLCRTPVMRVIAAVLIAYGVAIQAVGVYYDDDNWNRQPIPLEHAPQRVWDWSDPQIVRALRSGWHGTDLWPLLRKSFTDPHTVRLVELTASDLAAQIRLVGAPSQMLRGGRTAAFAEITNHGGLAWPAFSGDFKVRNVVMLIVRWLAAGEPLPGAGDVLALPENLPPGESLQMDIPLVAPARAGDYEVELRIVQALDGTRGVSTENPYRFRVAVR